MPSFDSLARWERYEPAIGPNLQIPPHQRFYLRVCAGLTVGEFKAVMDAMAAGSGSATEMAERLKGVVELGDEPLTVRGKPVATLAEYLDLASQQRGADLV